MPRVFRARRISVTSKTAPVRGLQQETNIVNWLYVNTGGYKV